LEIKVSRGGDKDKSSDKTWIKLFHLARGRIKLDKIYQSKGLGIGLLVSLSNFESEEGSKSFSTLNGAWD
jgi:hypothetical protein